jgi:hypothetical protein
MALSDLTFAHFEATEAFAISVGLGLCVLVLFRMCSRNMTLTHWATFDLIFVATQLTFFWVTPSANPAQLWSFSVLFAVILGSASLFVPGAQTRKPEPEAQEPTAPAQAVTSVEKFTKVA